MNTISQSENLLTVIMNLGKEMLMCGAEVNRVEDTISRLCDAYGLKDAEIFSITSLILVTVRGHEGSSFAQSRRVTGYVFNFYRLEELNALSRTVCSTTPSAEDFQHMLDEIIAHSHFSKLLRLLGFILTSSGFCLLFKGSLIDALCAGLISVGVFIIERIFTTFSINGMLYNFISSLFAGVMAFYLTGLNIGASLDKIMIGDIMLLIPGLMLTNAIKDMMNGDTMAGFLRFCEALLTALAIALGFWFSMIAMGVLSW
ncbi:MAG: threonine/serine exporter family protein [Clostridia bacterium]|nr:threonine/serine exporter family protein [Clostridia bacterium]